MLLTSMVVCGSHLYPRHNTLMQLVSFLGIFVIISIMVLLFKISDVIIAILVIGAPVAARYLMEWNQSLRYVNRHCNRFFQALLEMVLDSSHFCIKTNSASTDFYSPFKRIASCSLLLAYVDKNESTAVTVDFYWTEFNKILFAGRIFLIVQAISHLPKAVFQILTKNAELDVLVALSQYRSHNTVKYLLLILPLLLFCGLG